MNKWVRIGTISVISFGLFALSNHLMVHVNADSQFYSVPNANSNIQQENSGNAMAQYNDNSSQNVATTPPVVKAPKKYVHTKLSMTQPNNGDAYTATDGSNTFKTYYYLPEGFHVKDTEHGNYQSSVRVGDDIYVVESMGTGTNQGAIVRYNINDLKQLGVLTDNGDGKDLVWKALTYISPYTNTGNAHSSQYANYQSFLADAQSSLQNKKNQVVNAEQQRDSDQQEVADYQKAYQKGINRATPYLKTVQKAVNAQAKADRKAKQWAVKPVKLTLDNFLDSFNQSNVLYEKRATALAQKIKQMRLTIKEFKADYKAKDQLKAKATKTTKATKDAAESTKTTSKKGQAKTAKDTDDADDLTAATLNANAVTKKQTTKQAALSANAVDDNDAADVDDADSDASDSTAADSASSASTTDNDDSDAKSADVTARSAAQPAVAALPLNAKAIKKMTIVQYQKQLAKYQAKLTKLLAQKQVINARIATNKAYIKAFTTKYGKRLKTAAQNVKDANDLVAQDQQAVDDANQAVQNGQDAITTLQNNQVDYAKYSEIAHMAQISPLINIGHGQTLSYNPVSKHLYLAQDETTGDIATNANNVVTEIDPATLQPIKQFNFQLLHGNSNYAIHTLTFDNDGNAYFGRKAGKKYQIFKGQFDEDSGAVNFVPVPQTINWGGTHNQGLSYNPVNNRLYIISDDIITSVPADKLSNGTVAPSDVKYLAFDSKREFEDLTFDAQGYGYLLMLWKPEIMKSTNPMA